MTKRNDGFGRLLKAGMGAIAALEARTQESIEQEIGELLGVSGATLQRYKTGYLPPMPGAVEQLGELCVRRGLFGRIWLERFLEAAGVSISLRRELAGRLFATEYAQPTSTQPQRKLPPASYSRFIMRHAPYQAVLNGLRSQLPVTLLVSLGGMGKTSLAHAVAVDCLEGRHGAPRFVTVVWVSDKGREGTTNLSLLLDEIARILDYPGILGLPFLQRQQQVEQLLQRQAVLLVLDNAETITDAALAEWLNHLPGPSKVLITSRFVLPAYPNAYLVELGPLAASEARAFMDERLSRSPLRSIPNLLEQLTPLVAGTGGNAKAIELALGLLQHRTRDEVLHELQSARDRLFEDLFARAWQLLDRAAQRVLLVLPAFPGSIPASALAYCADLSNAAMQQSATQLSTFSLLDIERSDIQTEARYNAHSLVRAYAQARLAELHPSEQQQYRERWLAWCCDTAAAAGFCWNALERLDLLDQEHETIQAAIEWAAEQGRDQQLIMLVEGIRYYYNVRGLWGDRELRNHAYRVAAAQRLADQDNAAIGLAHQVQTFSKQGRLAEAAALLKQLQKVGEARYRTRIREAMAQAHIRFHPNHSLFDTAAFEYGHALGLYARNRGDLAQAEAYWRELLGFARELGGQQYVITRRWLATVLLQQGQTAAAAQLFRTSLEDARTIGDTRSISGNSLKLALIELQAGHTAAAAVLLEESRSSAEHHRDRRRLAEYHSVHAQLLEQQGEAQAARNELAIALDHFERLGMRRDAHEVQARRAALEQRRNSLAGNDYPAGSDQNEYALTY